MEGTWVEGTWVDTRQISGCEVVIGTEARSSPGSHAADLRLAAEDAEIIDDLGIKKQNDVLSVSARLIAKNRQAYETLAK